jgi:hypothetical protein
MNCFAITFPGLDTGELSQATVVNSGRSRRLSARTTKTLKGAAMPRQNSDDPSQVIQRQQALSRWDNEGGAADPTVTPVADKKQIPTPEMSNADLVALHVRVIALENLLISLLATASDQQLELAREMAGYITPRPGFTPHPLTIHAAAHMIDLIERSSRFR